MFLGVYHGTFSTVTTVWSPVCIGLGLVETHVSRTVAQIVDDFVPPVMEGEWRSSGSLPGVSRSVSLESGSSTVRGCVIPRIMAVSDTFEPVCFGPVFFFQEELVPDGLYASRGDSVTNTTENTQPMTSVFEYDVCHDDQGDAYNRKIQPATSSTNMTLV